MKISGSRVVIECLLEQGIDTVFGYPGGANLNIYDELYKNKKRIRHILTAHEQGATHAADGYARSTGKVGVVFATSGPGATNIVTGIATAYMDSSPVVAITCNVPTPLLGTDSFQEIDITGITMPITKHNFIVQSIEDLAPTIRAAFLIAKSGRPGPVLVDITKEVTAPDNLVDFTPLEKSSDIKKSVQQKFPYMQRLFKDAHPTDTEISTAAKLINEAQRPLIYAGGGVVISNSSKELLRLAETSNIPVAMSLMGRSGFPSTHPLSTWTIGMHGTKASNAAVSECDLLITLGARFSERVTSSPKNFALGAKIIQVDIDPAEENKNVEADLCLTGNLKDVLSRLLAHIKPNKRSAWISKINAWKKERPKNFDADKKNFVNPKFLCNEIHRVAGDNAIITTEVGEHQMWTSQFYPFAKPRTFLTSGGLGTMGFGTGAAIGAQFANPSARVINIAGDGSFLMNCNELATIAHYNLPVIIVVVSNGSLGNVRMWQKFFYENRYSETTLDFMPDWLKFAASFGIQAYTASSNKEFSECFEKAFKSKKAALIEARVDINEIILPMVPGGKPLSEQIMDA